MEITLGPQILVIFQETGQNRPKMRLLMTDTLSAPWGSTTMEIALGPQNETGQSRTNIGLFMNDT
jgi:hypothetical protein